MPFVCAIKQFIYPHRWNFRTALRQFATVLLLVLPCAAQNPPGVLFSTTIPSGPPGPPYVGAIAQDAAGNTYITGGVASNSLTTTPGVFQPSAPAGGAAFVAKLDSTGAVTFLTYIGGVNDSGSSIVADPAGHVYVGGITFSSNFPLAGSPYRPPLNGSTPYAFLAEISGDGKTLIWSTVLNQASAPQLALAPDGSLYDLFETVAPIVVNGGLVSPGASALAKLTGAGGFVAQMVVPPSTYSLAVGPDGSVYIGGEAAPGDITATPGAWQTTLTSYGGFVAKVNSSISGYAWVTYTGSAVASQLVPLPDGGSLWVDGTTGGTIAVTPGALQSQPGFGFLIRLSSDGSEAITATYLPSQVQILALDASGNLLIGAFLGYGGIFQATPGAPWPCETADVFIGTIDAAGQHVLGGTSLPATLAAPVAAGNNGNAVVAAQSRSSFALTVVAFNTATVSPRLVTSCILPTAGSAAGPLAAGEVFSIYGAGFGPSQGVVAQPEGGAIGTLLGGIQVTVEGTPVPLLYVSAAQINAVAPFLLEGRTAAHIEIVSASGSSNEVVLGVREALPEIFATSTGVAIVNQDGTLNSQSNPAHIGDVVSMWISGAGQTNPPGVDGAIPTAAGGTPVAPISLQAQNTNNITVSNAPGPIPAPIIYAGNAPGLVSGITQVNFQVPRLSGDYGLLGPLPVSPPPYNATLTLSISGATASTTFWFE